jgi:hypothetical protein
MGMTDLHNSPDALDELVTQLIECGAILSQIVGSMVQYKEAEGSPPGTAPIPDIAHGLIRSVVPDLAQRYSAAEIASAAAIVQQATKKMCDEIFIVPLDMN